MLSWYTTNPIAPKRRGHDPEAQDDLRLGPSLQLEVVMDRGHQEDAPAEGLKREDLDDDREHLDHEDPTEEDEQNFGASHDGEAGDGATEAKRARVTHEDAGRKAVEPQEADARADQASRHHGQIQIAADEGDPQVGQQDDRRTAGGQAVQAVGEVDRGRRPGHDQVDEDDVERPEVDRHVGEAQLHGLREVSLLGRHPPQPDGDGNRHHELGARPQAKGAALDDLRVVIGEAEQGAGDRRAEDSESLPVPVRKDDEGHGDRREDDHAAHRRRAGLGLVSLWPLLADVLSELAIAQEDDESRAEEQAHEQRRRPRDQDTSRGRTHQTRPPTAAAPSPTPRA